MPVADSMHTYVCSLIPEGKKKPSVQDFNRFSNKKEQKGNLDSSDGAGWSQMRQLTAKSGKKNNHKHKGGKK